MRLSYGMSTRNPIRALKYIPLGAIVLSKPQLLMLDHVEAKKTNMGSLNICSESVLTLQTWIMKLERCIVTPRPDTAL